MDVVGKQMLVTGASSGIGRATAIAGAKRGMSVALVARSAEKLADVASEIEHAGGRVSVHRCDVGDAEQVSQLARELPTPDIVFNNAGAGRWKSLVETTPEEAAQMMTVPYLAAFYVTRAFLPAMLERKSGVCVYMNSAGSHVAWPGAAAYIAARWAVRGLFEAVRAETAGTQVRAVMVTLAKVSSDYWHNNPGSEANLPKAQARIPILSPEQAAHAIIDGLEKDRVEIIAPWQLRMMLWISRMFPSAARRVMQAR